MQHILKTTDTVWRWKPRHLTQYGI